MPVVTAGSTTVGAVQISGLSPTATPIESWLNGMLQGKAYGASLFQPAIAGQRSFVELRNPLGSGKNLWVYTAAMIPAGANNTYYAFQTPPLLAAGSAGTNLLTGALNSVARIQNSSQVAAPGTGYFAFPGIANQIQQQVQPWIIVVAPNCSFIMYDNAVNDGITVDVTWMEV